MKTVWFAKPDLCTPCGGKCCKRLPGSAYPDDFPTREALAHALQSGRWAVDWWEGDAREGKYELGRTYYIRPAIKGFEGQKFHPSWGGECTFLTPDGCALPGEARPRECRDLEPMENNTKCQMHNGTSKKMSAIAWITRSDELGEPTND
jgi:Fe-S-cluster containining protein